MIALAPARVWNAARLPRRISTCDTLPDAIRKDADARAAAIFRAVPLAIWCRSSALLVLQARDYPMLSVGTGRLWRPVPPRPDRAWHALRTVGTGLCLGAATLVLAASRALSRAGLLSPRGMVATLRCVSTLTNTGMRLWRHGRSRGTWRPNDIR